ncbi:MAG: sugar phosphate isomerase/epimerase family protein [Planctomycetota bacterium]|jgi:inosose dehydratase
MSYRQVLGREQLIEKLDTVLGQVAAAGYVAVQYFIDCLTNEDHTDRYLMLLNKHNLQPAGLFTGGALHDKELAGKYERSLISVINYIQPCLSLNSITINPDPLSKGASKSDRQLEVQAEALIRIGKKLSDQGIRLIYRFSGPEIADDAREFKRMMRLVTSQYMGLCYDADCVARAGEHPIDLLDQFAPRVQETHLRSSRQGVWDQVLEDGDVDVQEVLELLHYYDFRGWNIVALAREAKTPKNMPLPEALRKSREYAQSVIERAQQAEKLY